MTTVRIHCVLPRLAEPSGVSGLISGFSGRRVMDGEWVDVGCRGWDLAFCARRDAIFVLSTTAA